MQIRRATFQDISFLNTLLEELFSQEIEFEPNSEAQVQGLSAILEDENMGVVFVACDEEKIMGMVSLLFTVSTALGSRVALLEDMIVSSEYQGLGIGSALIEHATEYAQLKECRRITLLTDEKNKAAQDFYQRQAFSRSSMVAFRKEI